MNGVSHHVVADDLAGVAAVLRWLSYTPVLVGDAPPLLPSCDPIDRPVAYQAPAGMVLMATSLSVGRLCCAGCLTHPGWLAMRLRCCYDPIDRPVAYQAPAGKPMQFNDHSPHVMPMLRCQRCTAPQASRQATSVCKLPAGCKTGAKHSL